MELTWIDHSAFVRLETTRRSELAAHGAPSAATERSPWRTAAVPTEHGGWGLTLEPVAAKVLGLRQMALGLGLVAVTAVGVLFS